MDPRLSFSRYTSSAWHSHSHVILMAPGQGRVITHEESLVTRARTVYFYLKLTRTERTRTKRKSWPAKEKHSPPPQAAPPHRSSAGQSLNLRSAAVILAAAVSASVGRRRLAAVRGLRVGEAELVVRDGVGGAAEEERLRLVLAVDGLAAEREGVGDAALPELVVGACGGKVRICWLQGSETGGGGACRR